MPQKRAFVLSAGGSRGALQAGALEALLQAGLQPDMVVGSSVGALNGAYFAQDPTLAGVRRLQALYRETDLSNLFSSSVFEMMLHTALGEANLCKNDTLHALVYQELGDRTFREMGMLCYLVATDVDFGKAHTFGDDEQEKVLDGVMSSAALTPLYPPWEVDGRLYADGGLVAMLPVMEAVERGAAEIYALNLANQLMPREQRNNVLDMLMHVVDILTQDQVHKTLYSLRQQTDITLHVIDLQQSDYVPFNDVSRMDEMIAQGRRLAEEALVAALA